MYRVKISTVKSPSICPHFLVGRESPTYFLKATPSQLVLRLVIFRWLMSTSWAKYVWITTENKNVYRVFTQTVRRSIHYRILNINNIVVFWKYPTKENKCKFSINH